jgi:hypothetical protein
MKISQQELYKIIVEEYIKEEGLEESQAAEDLLRQLIGDEEYERRRALDNPDSRGGDTAPMDNPNKAAKTMAIDMDTKADDIEAVSGSGLEDRLTDLIQGMPPEEVADLFQAVFAKIPGVEMSSPEEEPPSTEYVRGAYGRPKISSFGLDEIKQLIRKVLAESV